MRDYSSIAKAKFFCRRSIAMIFVLLLNRVTMELVLVMLLAVFRHTVSVLHEMFVVLIIVWIAIACLELIDNVMKMFR